MAKSFSNDVIRLAATFTSLLDVATNPTALTLVIRDYYADTVVNTYAIGDLTNTGAGAYQKDWTAPSVSQLTVYVVQWQPTGAVQKATTPDRVFVNPLVATA